MRRSFNGDYPITEHFGVVASYYSGYPGSKHPGTDYGLPANTPLVAGMSGTVTATTTRSTYVGRGNEVVITNGNKQRKTCHMNRIDVKVGETVTEGVTQIGLSGNTGYVLPKPSASNPNAGAHLHDELLIDGTYVNLENNLTQGAGMATVLTDALIEKEYLVNRGAKPSTGELAGWRGKTLDSLSFAFQAENDAKRTHMANIAKALQTAQEAINSLSVRPTKEEYARVQAIVNDKAVEIAVLQAKLEEAQNRPAVIKEVEVEPSWLRTAIDFIRSLLRIKE